MVATSGSCLKQGFNSHRINLLVEPCQVQNRVLTSLGVFCQGLIESCSEGSLANDPNIRMITLYDNEEVSEMETSCSSPLMRSRDCFFQLMLGVLRLPGSCWFRFFHAKLFQ